jgi:Tfp pilus assembly protein FimT
MCNASGRSGATLPELIVVLGLLAILGGMTFTASADVRNGVAVRAARDAAAGEIARARALATLHGSARLLLDPGSTDLVLEAPAGSPAAVTPLESGVTVTVDGRSEPVWLEFDALGLGRLANRTIRFGRGSAEARLTLSSYGRARRW